MYCFRTHLVSLILISSICQWPSISFNISLLYWKAFLNIVLIMLLKSPLIYYSFLSSQLGYRNLSSQITVCSICNKSVHSPLKTSKNHSLSESLSMLHCWLSASMYLHSSTCTWRWQLLSCLYTESSFATAAALQYMSYSTYWPWKSS